MQLFLKNVILLIVQLIEERLDFHLVGDKTGERKIDLHLSGLSLLRVVSSGLETNRNPFANITSMKV